MTSPRHLPWGTIWLAYGLFVASMFLPAIGEPTPQGSTSGPPLPGWQAFVVAPLAASHPLAILFAPRVLVYLLAPLASLLILAAPLGALIWRRIGLLSVILIPFGILPWFLPTSITGTFHIGFFCWNGAHFVMSAGFLLVSLVRFLTEQPGRMELSPCPTNRASYLRHAEIPEGKGSHDCRRSLE